MAPAVEPVELAVDGLLLRPPRTAEAVDALAMLLDHESVLWNPAPSVVDVPTARAWCERGADWSDGDHATFSVVDAATGRLLGNVSLHEVDHDRSLAEM